MSRPTDEVRSTSATRAGAVTIAGQLIKAFVQLIGLVAFSRLLSPYEIGLIAMLAVFVMLGELLRDFGLSQAAIQTSKLSHGQASNLFWTNVLVGMVMTATLTLAAPAVARMYGEPVLREIAPFVAFAFTINALQAQFQVRLARDFRFVALTVTDTASQVIGLAAGIGAAVAGASYWSLVIQMLGAYGSLLILRMIVTRWRPGPPRREPGMKALYLFGAHSGASQLINYVASNTDSYLIGVRWGAGPLGLYNRAFQIFSVPANQLLAPLTNVALPLLSRKHHEGNDFYPLLWKAQVVLSAGLIYVFTFTAALAEPLVHLVLGPKWGQSAPLLAILSIGGAAQVLSYISYWGFLASGNAKQLFYFSLVTKPMLVACILTGSVAGVQGVAWGFTTGLALSWFISLWWLKRCAGMPAWMFLRTGLHVLFCGFAAGGAVRVADSYVDLQSTVATLVGGCALASCLYVPLLLVSGVTRKLLADVTGRAVARVRRAGPARGQRR
ncbi:lipopolysaccharide biosynthesis protein [Mycolicibacterium canariasense]|uniref:lipopolysaccharide biosynthesis protein n=1 Tax=Mycolicibacterium canariasense TaxID=228230 RepID=UPI0009FBC44F|nr:lipopolysaccharide biosynthesis protein [Mycolicibacterium canariasense]